MRGALYAHSVACGAAQARGFLLSVVPPPWAANPASLDPTALSVSELLDLLQVQKLT